MRVWVTRDESDDGPLCAALRAHGLEPVLVPVLQRRVLAEALHEIARLAPDDWLVLTSPYAIEAAACDAARTPRVAVVSEPSRRVAAQHGMRVELVSTRGDGQSLFDELRRVATDGVVCYLRSSLAKEPAPWSGVELRCAVLYETVPRAFDRAVIQRVNVIAVASASAVRAIGPTDLPLASIGRSTSAAIRALGVEPWLEAPSPSFDALAAAIAARAPDQRRRT